MSAMRMLISSANCARMPPADLLVDPLPQRFALAEHHIGDPELGEMERGAGAHGAAPDDHDLSRFSRHMQILPR